MSGTANILNHALQSHRSRVFLEGSLLVTLFPPVCRKTDGLTFPA